MNDVKNEDGERDRGPFGLKREKERHQIGINPKIGKGSLKNHRGRAGATLMPLTIRVKFVKLVLLLIIAPSSNGKAADSG